VRALFDVSLVLALFDVDHGHHPKASRWWAANGRHGWASCPLTQNGFIRIIAGSGYPRRLLTAQGISLLGKQIELGNHEFWSDGLSILDPEVFDHSFILGPKQLTDVYLLALAVTNGGRLVTFDRGIPLRAVCGAEARHIVVL
jgi:uncharacterized protein